MIPIISFHRKIQFFVTIFIYGCSSSVDSSHSLKIFPQDCIVPTSGQIGITLQGSIEPNSQVVWESSLGSIVNNVQGFGAIYTAPPVTGEAIIKATISSGVNSTPIKLSLTCRIIDPTYSTPTTFPPLQTITPSLQYSSFTVVISELMGNPCGDLSQRKYNQYVELYNYGDQAVDVGGWWLYDEGEAGTPDQLLAWQYRSLAKLGNNLIVDSTVILPGGVAVILSPQYTQNVDLTRTPYQFPAGTVILTVSASDTLGDDFFGIIADQNGYDTLTLYIGGFSVIERVVDTYGTPHIPSAYPFEIQDDFKDNIPTYLSECSSIERINPRMPDSVSNWKVLLNGSPGEFPNK